MKITLSWLKDHLETGAGAEEIAEKLTAIGLEVESVEDSGARLKDFTVAHVLSAEKHPNADRLKLCMVDTGADIVQVVCGAPNAHTGMKAVFAKPGVTIPASGDVLKVGTIRGVESRGMLCSERELLLSDEHEGIIELAADAEIGAPAAAALGLDDPLIDIAITPNRGDATSVYGIARDLAAAGLGRLKDGHIDAVPGTFSSPIAARRNFSPETENACPVFAGRFIRNVKNGPSPEWVQKRLKAVGLRPISALVDITNLIAHDRGRPLHVFDAAKLSGPMQARLAHEGETLLALDGKTYTLDGGMTVIADENAACSIAGVMGGEKTGCTETTRDVFVESAWFDPARTARTGRMLGIVSDARYRFERGVDPQFVIPGLELATRLILEFCGGEPSEITVAGAPPAIGKTLSFSPADVKKLTGLAIHESQIVTILTDLGFAVTSEGASLTVAAPDWRSDIAGKADLVEEIVRIYGLNHVPSVAMARPRAVADRVLTPAQWRTRIVRRLLAARGFNETISYSFIARAHALLFGGGDEARQIENPIAADMDALRPSLLPSLAAAASRNAARGFDDLMLFEIGAAFDSGAVAAQKTVAAGLQMGGPARNWAGSGHPPDAFDAKAAMLAALEAMMGAPMSAPIRAGAPGWYHPGRAGTLALGQTVLGHFGELHPKILAAFDLKGPVAAFEINLDAIPEPKAKAKFRPVFAPSPYPAVERDFAFVVNAKVSAEEILRAARTAERNLIESIGVFDVYEGKGVAEGQKSIAIAVRLQPKERTLTDAEIETIGQKIVAAVAKATGGSLRS